MTLCRTLLFATVVVAAPVVMHVGAYAQFGGMPGMPGSPGMSPGMPGAGFGAPQEPPAACQQLLTYRDETAKHGHFGRSLPTFTWENTGKAAALKKAAARWVKSFFNYWRAAIFRFPLCGCLRARVRRAGHCLSKG